MMIIPSRLDDVFKVRQITPSDNDGDYPFGKFARLCMYVVMLFFMLRS